LTCFPPPVHGIYPSLAVEMQLALLVGIIILFESESHVAECAARLLPKIPHILAVMWDACAAAIKPLGLLANSNEATANGGRATVECDLRPKNTSDAEHFALQTVRLREQ